MKLRFIQKRKLKAATVARRMPRAAEEEGQEPSISFGRAITIVLVLHLVAVGGICAFLSIKDHSHPGQQAAAAGRAAKETPQAAVAATPAAGQASAQDAQAQPREAAVPATTPVKQPAASSPSTVATASSVKDSGTTYTVAKGDTPVSIAKKLHVSYDDLLRLNKISDPKKLKIGQKLRIPMKKKPTPTTQVPADSDDEQMS